MNADKSRREIFVVRGQILFQSMSSASVALHTDCFPVGTKARSNTIVHFYSDYEWKHFRSQNLVPCIQNLYLYADISLETLVQHYYVDVWCQWHKLKVESHHPCWPAGFWLGRNDSRSNRPEPSYLTQTTTTERDGEEEQWSPENKRLFGKCTNCLWAIFTFGTMCITEQDMVRTNIRAGGCLPQHFRTDTGNVEFNCFF